MRISDNQKNQVVIGFTEEMLIKVRFETSKVMTYNPIYKSILGDRFHNYFVGYCGEIALAEYLDVPWESEYIQNKKRVGDVMGYQVKSTERADGNLLTNPNETSFAGPMPAGIYVLIIVDLWGGQLGTATVIGWEDSVNLWTPDLWDLSKPSPCYVQDQQHLNPMKHLPDTAQMRSFKASWAS